ncbi:MAG TPA: hypothetical protein VF465_21210, partial [Flavobacterium sp.]|uniref:RipA family octameric membrane protein n=1 Tax=Flavobacterium sp. TaxID=239 RepID=UPI002ED5BF67
KETNIDNECKINLEKRYEILIRARNFHYENFNKWMSYFYVMIGSLILGFSYIVSKSTTYSSDYRKELIALTSIGFTISLFWHWANKGYYYWNINFITLVNHYEKNLLKFKESERIYFVFANKDSQNNYSNPFQGANISTSKISILLSYLFVIFFGSYAFSRLLENYITSEELLVLVSALMTATIVYLLSKVLAKPYLKSYHDHFPDLEIDSKKSSSYKDLNNFTT